MSSIYDDGRFRVTGTSFSTPSRIYPLHYATASVRRDLFFVAAGITAVAGVTLAVYRDLLLAHEIVAVAVLPVVAVLIAMNMGMLALDAPGHRRVIFLARAKTVREIFKALREARAAEISAPPLDHHAESYAAMDSEK